MSLDELFGSLIENFPHIKILVLANKGDLASLKALSQSVYSHGGVIDLYSFDDDFSQELGNVFFKAKLQDAHDFEARGYEILCAFNIKLDETTLKACYHALENSGNIFIFSHTPQDAQALLERCNFVAINSLNAAGFEVLSAKKMHGWGGGL